MAHATKPPRPLSKRPLTRRQASQLEWDIWCAVNRWQGRYASGKYRSCVLCGAASPRYPGGHCRWCHTVPEHTREGWDAIDRIRAGALRQEGGAV